MEITHMSVEQNKGCKGAIVVSAAFGDFNKIWK
jgi:hypothetical protein